MPLTLAKQPGKQYLFSSDWIGINTTFPQLLRYFKVVKGTNNCEINLLVGDVLDAGH